MKTRQFLLVLIALAICEANEQPITNKSPDLQEQQYSFPPRCHDCNPGLLDVVEKLNFQQVLQMLNVLQSLKEKWNTLTTDVSNKMLGNLEDLTESIRQLLIAIQNNIGLMIDELSTTLQKIFKCSTLPVLLTNLKNNLLGVLNVILNQKYEPFFRPKDVSKLIAGLAHTLEIATPNIVKLLQQLVMNLLELFGLCKDLYVVVVLFLSESSLTSGIQMVIDFLKAIGREMKGKGLSDLVIQQGRLAMPIIAKTFLENMIEFINKAQSALSGGGIESLLPAHINDMMQGMGLNINTEVIANVVDNLAKLSGGSLGDNVKAVSAMLGKVLNAAYQGAIKQDL